MSKKILIAISVFIILILGYGAYNMVAAGKIDEMLKDQEAQIEVTAEELQGDDSLSKKVEELKKDNSEFFYGSSMSSEEIGDLEASKAKVKAYIEEDTKKQRALIDDMNAVSMGAIIPLGEKKESIIKLHQLNAQLELDMMRSYDAEKLERYDWAMSVCNGEKTVDEIIAGKPMDEQNNIVLAILEANETLCDQEDESSIY